MNRHGSFTNTAIKLNLMLRYSFALLFVFAIAGCGGPAEDPETVAIRNKYVISAEPADPLSLTQAAALVGIKPDKEDAAKIDAEAASASEPDDSAADTADTADTAEPATADTGAASAPAIAEASDVTLVGRIYAGELEPWEDGKASFMLSELPEDGHGEGHDSDNCPFCKRRLAKAPTAIVRFVDAQGETLPIDARKLFGLEKGQTVVVRGTVVAGEFNSIVMIADQMHVRSLQ